MNEYRANSEIRMGNRTPLFKVRVLESLTKEDINRWADYSATYHPVDKAIKVADYSTPIKIGVAALLILGALVYTPKLRAAEIGDCGNEKTVMCHIPPGNPENSQMISISSNAVETHRTHHNDIWLGCGKAKDFENIDCASLVTSDEGGNKVAGFGFTLCDNRTGETGRAVSVTQSGRPFVSSITCE